MKETTFLRIFGGVILIIGLIGISVGVLWVQLDYELAKAGKPTTDGGAGGALLIVVMMVGLTMVFGMAVDISEMPKSKRQEVKR